MFVCKSCRCVSSIQYLEGWGVEERHGLLEGEKKEQEEGASSGQVRQKMTGRWRCCPWSLIHVGQREDGERSSEV